MTVNPLASMGLWPVVIYLGGQTYEIPPLPASDWWPVLAGNNLMDVLDLAPEQGEIEDRMLLGELTVEEVQEALRDTLEAVSGRSVHSAYVIVATAEGSWHIINGHLIRRGFRWPDQPLAAVLDAIQVTVLELLDKEHADRFLAALKDPVKRRADPEARGDFETMAGPRPSGGVRSSAGLSGSGRPRTRRRPPPPHQADPSAGPMPQP